MIRLIPVLIASPLLASTVKLAMPTEKSSSDGDAKLAGLPMITTELPPGVPVGLQLPELLQRLLLLPVQVIGVAPKLVCEFAPSAARAAVAAMAHAAKAR